MKLRNRSNRTEILVLDHDVVCESDSCQCSTHKHTTHELDPQSGEVGRREIEKPICPSVHILPKSTTDELPDSVANLPRVRELIRAKVLVEVQSAAAE